MKPITRSQKLYLAAMGVGLCALVYDKTLGGGPAPAVASPPPVAVRPELATAVSSSGTLPAASSDPALAAFDRRLAGRLATLATLRRVADGDRDGFVPSPGWHIDDAVHSGPSVDAIKFQQQHTLKAIVQGRRGQAMVDNSLVTIGQTIDGFKLVGVDRMRAVFTDGQNRAELSLAGAEARPVTAAAP